MVLSISMKERKTSKKKERAGSGAFHIPLQLRRKFRRNFDFSVLPKLFSYIFSLALIIFKGLERYENYLRKSNRSRKRNVTSDNRM